MAAQLQFLEVLLLRALVAKWNSPVEAARRLRAVASLFAVLSLLLALALLLLHLGSRTRLLLVVFLYLQELQPKRPVLLH